LANALRIRAFVTDVRDTYAVYSAVKDAIPVDPPAVAVAGVPGPLHVEGCSVVVDAVVYAPE
jgi:Na+-translocating ferredoxin:NAD+ oxidoreductase RnfC subunit